MKYLVVLISKSTSSNYKISIDNPDRKPLYIPRYYYDNLFYKYIISLKIKEVFNKKIKFFFFT